VEERDWWFVVRGSSVFDASKEFDPNHPTKGSNSSAIGLATRAAVSRIQVLGFRPLVGSSNLAETTESARRDAF
jgi:hypothetical protein